MLTLSLFLWTLELMVTHIFNSYHEWELASLCSCMQFIDLLRPPCTVAPPFHKQTSTDPSVHSLSALGISTIWSSDHSGDNWLVIAWVRHNQFTKSSTLINSFSNVSLTCLVKLGRKNAHWAKLTPSLCLKLAYWLRLTCKAQHMITDSLSWFIFISRNCQFIFYHHSSCGQ